MRLDEENIYFLGLTFIFSVLIVMAIHDHDKKQPAPLPTKKSTPLPTKKSTPVPEKIILTGWSEGSEEWNEVRYTTIDGIICIESQKGGLSCKWPTKN